MAGEAMSAFVRFFVKDEVSGAAGKVERAAKDAADGLDEAADAAGKRLASAFDKAKGHATDLAGGLKTVGTAGAALFGGMVALTQGTAEYQENMGKLNTAFTDAGHSAETASAVYGDLVGIVGDSDIATEAAGHLAMLTKDTEQLAEWTDISAGVYAKWGDSLPLEALAEASSEVSKTGVLTGGLTDALVWAGISEEEFNQKLAACNSEQERAALITETLNGIYGEAGQAYQENNADLIEQRQAQDALTAAMTELGNTLRPLMNDFMQLAAELATRLQPVFQWLIDHLPVIAPLVAGIATAFLAYSGISAIVSGISAVMTILRDRTLLMAAAQAALNLVMNLNPFVLVATLIAGLVAAFITAYATSETFRNKVNAAFESVKAVITTIVNAVKGAISGMATAISSTFNAIKNTISSAVSTIKGLFNFSWSLPKPKLPRFSVSGGKAPWGFMGQGSLPRVGIKWYADGALFSEPTIFATPRGFKGVGEAGPEAVAPVSVLMDYIRQAVGEARGGGYVANINIKTGETDESKLARLIAREEKRQAYALGVI